MTDTNFSPVPRDMLSLHLIVERHQATLMVAGEVDRSTSERLRRVVVRALQSPTPLLRLDLSQVTFFDSSGVHALVEATRFADLNGHCLELERVPRQVLRILDAARARSSVIIAPDATLRPPPPGDPLNVPQSVDDGRSGATSDRDSALDAVDRARRSD